MKSKWLKYIGVILLALFLTIGVPILINELYKVGAGYITMWEAPDVLVYYGTLLGAFVGIITLAITIIFTRKQITRDSFLKSEHEKWDRIEAVFADALEKINPMYPLNKLMDNGLLTPADSVTTIQQYMITSSIAMDQLNSCLNVIDFPKVKALIEAIGQAVTVLSALFEKNCTEYRKLADLNGKQNVVQLLALEADRPGSFPAENVEFSKELLKRIEGLSVDVILQQIANINVEIAEAYNTTYRPLLQLKGGTFELIDTDIQKNADSILKLWGKK